MIPPTPWRTIQGSANFLRIVDANGNHVCDVGYGAQAVATAALIVRAVNDLAAGFTEEEDVTDQADEACLVSKLMAERDRLRDQVEERDFTRDECHMEAAANDKLRARLSVMAEAWQKLADENAALRDDRDRLSARNTILGRARKIDAGTIHRLTTTLEVSDNYRLYERIRNENERLAARVKALEEAARPFASDAEMLNLNSEIYRRRNLKEVLNAKG